MLCKSPPTLDMFQPEQGVIEHTTIAAVHVPMVNNLTLD